MMEDTNKCKDQIDQFTLDFKFKEMKLLVKECKKFEVFLGKVSYFKSIDDDFIYREYEEIFAMKNADISKFKSNQDFKTMYDEMTKRSYNEEIEKLKK